MAPEKELELVETERIAVRILRFDDAVREIHHRVTFLQRDLDVSRLTATRYLDALARDGVLEKTRVGRNNYYINRPLFSLLSGEGGAVTGIAAP